MSYRCHKCNSVHSGKQLKRIAEVREVTYNRFFQRKDFKTKEKKDFFVENYKGQEIVREELLCSDCYTERKDMSPVVDKNKKDVNFVGKKPQNRVTSKTDQRRFNSFKELGEKYGTAKSTRRNGRSEEGRRGSPDRDRKPQD